MTADRRRRLRRLVVERAHGAPVAVEHLCAVAISAAGVDGAVITVILSAAPHETIYASDRVASELEELTLTLGEGPGMDASAGSPALASDLTSGECTARWPVFAPAAVQVGARAVFALPLQVGAIRLGQLCLYRGHPGGLDAGQLADALVLADEVCALLLNAAQRDPLRPDGRWRGQDGLQHPEVHQATGMITVQLGVNAEMALVRLRAYAYAHDRRLRDVAGDVVARRLRFEPDAEDDERRGSG